MEQPKSNTKMEGFFKQLMYPVLIACLAYFIKFNFEQMNAKIDKLTDAVQQLAVDNSVLKARLINLERNEEDSPSSDGWNFSRDMNKPDEIILKKRKP